MHAQTDSQSSILPQLPFAFGVESVPTPCYVVDTGRLEKNLGVLSAVQKRAGCKILLALKGFALWRLFPLIHKHLAGACASSLDEARLAREEFGGEVHVYAPAYKETEFDELLRYVDHVNFNSFGQWQRFRPWIQRGERIVECGIRVNPQHSEVKVALYDPCAKHSRLGVTLDQFLGDALDGISGLHFHTLCELNADALERTLAVVESKFGKHFPSLKWVNFGGGHHITRKDYDVDKLCELVTSFRDRYHLEVYLEPGEAIALHAGVLVASVLDIIRNEMDIAILDTSATAHMPDVIEMPYRPEIAGAGKPEELPHTYRLGGLTCLAGDVIGDYSFSEPLKVGDKLVFLDMAHYTMVKNTTFNGVRLPSIAIHHAESGRLDVVREFIYGDYKGRLG
ncbi:MAG: carboxynorspermidine decarboxylase [Candidatus Hydrogenedentes bacterium]|nr:carboxynorspermidine decarboxylase [Candidatus Hydrogenedentota bacterium]